MVDTCFSTKSISEVRSRHLVFTNLLIGILETYFQEITEKAIVLLLATYMFLICFAKWPAPRVALHNASLLQCSCAVTVVGPSLVVYREWIP